MKEQNSTESVELTVAGYASPEALALLQEALDDDCAGMEFTFERIKIPAGGTTAFEVPGEDDEPEMSKDVTGVILFHHPAYAYYVDKYTGGNNPPDCGSFDGVTGLGMPGGDCASCPYNQFGSGEGQSKACKNRRMLYLLREKEIFPLMLNLPTGSLKEFTKFVKRQLTKGRKLNQMVTKITLKKATSATGIAYSQASFSFVRMLNPNERAAVQSMTDQVKVYAANPTTSALTPADADIPAYDPETGEVVEPLQ